MDAGMRGTAMGQDSRFKDKEAASIKATKFPKNFNEKVDLRKVNLSVLRGWIANKVTELIRIEDDVVVEYCFGMLEDKDKPIPDPRKMQVSLEGFMNKYGAAAFMEALWTLLLSAQATVGGVPAEIQFIAAKKAELEQRQVNERNQQDASRPPPRDGRAQASDSFDRNPRDNRGPSRPDEHDYRKGPPPRRFNDRDRQPYGRDRDQGYDNRDRGYGGRPGGDDGRDDRNGGGRGGYGMRGGGRGGGYDRRDDRRDYGRPRSRSPPRYRRRSPSPRRRSPSPKRRSPSPRRRRSPSPRDRSLTPPLRTKASRDEEDEHNAPARPARRAISPVDDSPRRLREQSRTPTASDRSRGRSRSRSPTVTPPQRGRRDSTPPARRRRDDDTPSPPPKRRRRSPSDSRSPPRRRRSITPPRRRSPSPDRRQRVSDDGEDDGVNKKGRGRFTVEEEEQGKKKLEGRLGQSKWARDD